MTSDHDKPLHEQLGICAKGNDANRNRCLREAGHEGPHAHKGHSWHDQHVPREEYGGLSLRQWLDGVI